MTVLIISVNIYVSEPKCQQNDPKCLTLSDAQSSFLKHKV